VSAGTLFHIQTMFKGMGIYFSLFKRQPGRLTNLLWRQKENRV